DTAYVYLGGTSEVAIKEAVVDRYPRDRFQVASKLPLFDLNTAEEMEAAFDLSLSRAGLDYFDFYLLHAMDQERFEKAEKLGAWEFILRKKAEGKIRHIGFSFHDSAAVLDQGLTKHPEAEFVQLQINYIDWENPDVQSRECYEVAIKHGKPVIIMEPVKGGSLVSLTPEVSRLYKEVNPELSIPSWAIRYCASLPNIITVLSGMSTEAQLNDNVSYMEHFVPLDEREETTVAKAVEIINKIPTIPCTGCKYCVDGCPQKINIPAIFSGVNHHKKFDSDSRKASNQGSYLEAVKSGGKASDCIACGACESHCPQHISIIEELKTAAALYEN
ncbi:MAG: aldo/keto reductase, partial [Oscillospiraceae bacterium]